MRQRLVERRLGELDPADRDSLEAHVAACSGCAALDRETAGVLARLVADAAEEHEAPVPPADVVRLFPRRATPAPRQNVARRAAAAAAAAMVAALGLAVLLGWELSERAGGASRGFEVEAIQPVVRAEIERALAPAFRDVAAWMASSEERHARELALIARWLEERRVEEAMQLASALAATRNDLRLTQEAVLVFANDRSVPR